MRTIPAAKSAEGVYGIGDETLDELWLQAATLGRVSLEMSILHRGIDAEIAGKMPSGSRAQCSARKDDPRDALRAAIAEARMLGLRNE